MPWHLAATKVLSSEMAGTRAKLKTRGDTLHESVALAPTHGPFGGAFELREHQLHIDHGENSARPVDLPGVQFPDRVARPEENRSVT